MDTNIFVYSLDEYDKQKKEQSRHLLQNTIREETVVISTQVLQELYVVGTTKLKIDSILMKNILHSFENLEIVIIDTDLIKEAIDVSVLNRVSFWDATTGQNITKFINSQIVIVLWARIVFRRRCYTLPNII